MIEQRFHAYRKLDTRSFTLVEMLVAIAITGLILVAMFTMISLADSVWRQGIGRVDNFTRARAMLDLITGDLEGGVFRPDLPAFGTFCTGDTVITANGRSVLQNSSAVSTNAFYTRRAGVGASVRDLSLVIYSLNGTANAALNRSYLSVPWTPTGSSWASVLPFQTSQPNTSAATAMDTAEGVVGFELLFLRSDGSLTNAYSGYQASNPVVGLVVGLAVVDTPTLQFLNAQNKLSTLEAGMATAITGTNSPKSEWDVAMTSTFYQSYPESMRSGLKTFERSVYCRTGF
jgi:hypothetical protein